MNAEFKAWLQEYWRATSLGISGTMMGVFLLALLSRFPNSVAGQPIWFFNILEIAISFIFGGYGFLNMRRLALQGTAIVWNSNDFSLPLLLKMQRLTDRTQILVSSMVCFNAPFSWFEGDWGLPASSIKLILLIPLFILVMTKNIQVKETEQHYKQVFSPEVRKEHQRIVKKSTNLLLYSGLFMTFIYLLPFLSAKGFRYDMGWTVDSVLGSPLVLAALIPIGIQLTFARQVQAQPHIPA